MSANLDVVAKVLESALSFFFGIVQVVITASFGVLIKLYIDMNAAFAKIRDQEKRIKQLEEEKRR